MCGQFDTILQVYSPMDGFYMRGGGGLLLHVIPSLLCAHTVSYYKKVLVQQ